MNPVMGTSKPHGFTIIETVLFLGITGALIIGMIAGASVSLNVQRYRDATTSFKSLVQEQYADLANVQNSRTGAWTCDATATVVAGGTDTKGQSDCVLVGKYMRVDQAEISIYPVLAYETSTSTQPNDIQALRNNYRLNASIADVEERTMEWGTEIAWPASGADARSPVSPRTIGIFFVRSPDSGLIYTFTDDEIPDKTAIVQGTFDRLLVQGNVNPGQGGRTICVNANGLVSAGQQAAITMESYAASAGAIETRNNGNAGLPWQC